VSNANLEAQTTNMDRARFNMVEQQVRTWEVLDQRVLDLLHNIAREDFVPAAYRGVSYADTSIPLEDGQFMLPPRVIARIMQALEPQRMDRVLEVGTGSGYLTRMLASLCAHVVSVECSATLHAQAAARIKAQGIRNVTLVHGDALRGWESDSPYDAIALTGSVPELDPAIRQQLKLGGRLFAIIGRSPAMEAVLITRVSADEWSTESLFETVVEPLSGAEEPRRFRL
jgi:protein-L-isoaspartate(D-aspartate) O-methyltransferase